MRKILLLFICLILLTGCNSKNKQKTYSVKDGDKETILKMNGKDVYNKNQLLTDSLTIGGVNNIFESIIEKIYTYEKLEDPSKKADEEINKIKNQLKDNFKTQLAMQGFKDENALKQNVVQNLKIQNLMAEYVKKDQDKYFNLLRPLKLQYASFDKEDNAKQFVKQLKENKNFETSALQNGTLVDSSVQIFTEKSQADEKLKAEILNNPKVGITDIKKLNVNGVDRYYIINIIDTDPKKYEKEAILEIAKTVNFQEMLSHYLKKYNFKVYVQNLYDELNSQMPDLFQN